MSYTGISWGLQWNPNLSTAIRGEFIYGHEVQSMVRFGLYNRYYHPIKNTRFRFFSELYVGVAMEWDTHPNVINEDIRESAWSGSNSPFFGELGLGIQYLLIKDKLSLEAGVRTRLFGNEVIQQPRRWYVGVNYQF